MKSLVIASLLLVTSINFADKLEDQVLRAIVANPSAITLIDEETKKPVAENQQLVALLADALSQNVLALEDEGALGWTTLSCRNTTKKGLVGASTFKCTVSIGSGGYKKETENTIVGPETESASIFEIEVTKAVVPNAKPVIKTKKAVVQIAG